MLTARQKKRTIDDLAEELGIAAEIEDEPEEKYTARQRKRRKEETAPETEPEQPAEVREDSPKARRNAIIAAAAGAAVLFAIDPLMDILGFTAPGSSGGEFQFASDNAAVFSEIYTAYTNGRISSEKTQKLSENEQIFGDMLINSGKELGVFSSGNTLWSAEPDGISVYALDSGGLAAHVLPPEGAEFVKVVQTDSGVTAVYSGDAECGLIGVDDSGETWSCGQSGTLTDIFCGEDVIRLGSVYTPGFTKSFTVDDVLEYLPYGSKNGQHTAFSPAEIAVSGSADGCSYAVWGEYAAENGEQKKRLAALGSPIYSGAESFTAAMTRENGSAELTSDGGSLVSAALPEITACAAGNGVIADAEISNGGVTVYLRDSALKPLAAFTTGGEIDHLRISGNVVYVGSGGYTVMAVDISDTSSPKALDLTSADGVVSGDYALCGAVSKTGITLTLYKLESGKAVQADSFAKALTASELESFRFSGTNCFVINGTDCSGAAYRYFDGVSVVDEFAELGRSRSLPLEGKWQQIDVLVNNAGLVLGMDKEHEGSLDEWDIVIDTNIKALLAMTRMIVPGMVERQRGHIINIGSIAGDAAYAGGSVYCATKAAVKALSDGLRIDLVDTPLRVTNVKPGMVETNFSVVRFRGDKNKADAVYNGIRPLTGEDIAEVVYYAASAPEHVQIAEVLVMPTYQATGTVCHRQL